MKIIKLLVLSLSITTPALAEIMDTVPPQRDGQVVHANYMQSPYNKWGFHHASRVMPTAMIARAGEFMPFKENIMHSLADVKVDEKRAFAQVFAEHHADGLVVLQDDELVFERYFNGMSRHDRHMWYSMTKSLVTSAFGILVDQGRVDLQKSPADYIPELKGSGFERLSIQQVLDHTSGLAIHENYTDPTSKFLTHYAPVTNIIYIPRAKDAMPNNTEIFGIHDFLAKYVSADETIEPGEVFEYNSTNADVIGWLVSRLSGKDLGIFIEENIWQKLGVEHDGAMVVDRAAMPVATGGMMSTARDAARFGQMILHKGKFNGQQILPVHWLEQTTAITLHYLYTMAANPVYQDNDWQAYHNMWWLLDAEAGEFAAVGIHGQVIYINRSTNTVIAYFSSQPVASAARNPDFIAKLQAARAMARYLNPAH